MNSSMKSRIRNQYSRIWSWGIGDPANMLQDGITGRGRKEDRGEVGKRI
jgi:hypothetical protein